MRIKKIFLSLVFLSFACVILGQDLNQTNMRYSPLYMNPALTGSFYGTLRLGGTYRDQGRQLMGEGYKTFNVFVDAPISISIRKNDWIGIGIQAYNDKAGSALLVTQGVILNGGYHLSFDNKHKNVLSVGVQYGLLQKRIDGDRIVLGSDHVDPGVTLTDRVALSAYKASFKDINIGISFESKLSKASRFIIGVAAYHVTKPEYKGISYNNYLDRRITLHTRLHLGITKRFMVEPQIIASFSKNALNIMPQFKSFFKLSKNKRKDDMIYFGLGYRLNDAMQVLMGLRYKKFDIGMAYDITTSSAAQYNNHKGGIEFGLFKIIEIHKKRTVPPVLICPEL